MSIQMMLLGTGAVATKTYVDDVFSTYLWKGTAAQKTITNGIDLSTEGGMVWLKSRSTTNSNIIADTERGINKTLVTETSAANDTAGGRVDQFNTDGFRVGNDTTANGSNFEMASWTWRKAPGFFDCVKWQGNGTAGRQISHSLNCVPGLIIIKGTDLQSNWMVYHRDLGNSTTNSGNFHLWLNGTSATQDDSTVFNDTLPTASNFTVGTSGHCNGNNYNYVAYLFAGGASTAATARSVSFPGTGTVNLSIADSSDFDLGTTFTIEAWVKPDYSANIGYYTFFRHGNLQLYVRDYNGGIFDVAGLGGQLNSGDNSVPEGQWTHVAVVANSGTVKLYVNGVHNQNTTRTGQDYSGTATAYIGSRNDGFYPYKGEISNLRIVKGTAVYTSSFRPPTEPLTNITNTKLLCCNNSSTTGSTVTPGTITANGSPTASTDSPFDDPAGFAFGENEDQNVIKCGSYIGNGSTTGPEINLGWEPQWLLCKKIDNQGGGANISNWHILDSMRGTASGGPGVADDQLLMPNLTNAEVTIELADFASTGFKNTSNRDAWNYNGDEYIYVAIRRPDGYVGKPPELGTSVFAMDTGNSSANGPAFDSNFAVDFTFSKEPASSGYWITTARLINKWLRLNDTNAEASLSSYERYDLSKGVHQQYSSSNQAFMFKRHAGFDVVAAKGGQNKRISHSLSKTPEMYWVKNRDAAENWTVYHKGLNGGTNPENRYIVLNSAGGESGSDTSAWNSFVPTSTHISFGTMDTTGGNSSHNYLVMLFASVSGISKVGYYDGSSSAQTITTGFQPRFVIIKSATGSASWLVLDTTRGWGDNAQPYPNQTKDPYLYLDSDAAQGTNHDFGKPTSTGFELTATADGIGSKYNTSGQKFIYYAHA